MRKWLFLLTLVLGVALCAFASGETITLSAIYATVEIDDSYIILTPDNLDLHPEWLANRGTDKETLLADWTERGVLLQAWKPEGDACLEITAVQDEEAQRYFNIDAQTTATRSAYRTAHLKNTRGDGWNYSSAEWKKTTQYGRFLMLRYKRDTADGSVSGYARRTIRNGYTITLDYQAHGRGSKKADDTALNKIIGTWHFTQLLDQPADAAAKVVITSRPPAETNTGKFTVKGTCDPSARLIGVVMRMSSPDPIVYEVTASKKGSFSMEVTLPEEGVWLMTMTAENGNVVTEELVFDTTTYQKTLLPVNLSDGVDLDLAEGAVNTLKSDQTVISGTTIKGVTVQCIVSGPETPETLKQIKTNGTGAFSFKLDTSAEGDYDITLVFSKKGMSTRRFTLTAGRTLTEADIRSRAREEAVKPAYSTLTKKLDGYTGRTMVYNLYVQEIRQTGDEWLIFMAMTRTKSGVYKNTVVVTTDQEPNFSVDSQQRMYGVCTGPYEVTTEESSQSYPSFRLLFWD